MSFDLVLLDNSSSVSSMNSMIEAVGKQPGKTYFPVIMSLKGKEDHWIVELPQTVSDKLIWKIDLPGQYTYDNRIVYFPHHGSG